MDVVAPYRDMRGCPARCLNNAFGQPSSEDAIADFQVADSHVADATREAERWASSPSSAASEPALMVMCEVSIVTVGSFTNVPLRQMWSPDEALSMAAWMEPGGSTAAFTVVSHPLPVPAPPLRTLAR